MNNDIRTDTLLNLARLMQAVNKTMTDLNRGIEEMMQDIIMRDLREEMKGADDE